MTEIAEHSRQFVLKSRPVDLPGDENFAIETTPVVMPGPGQVLVKILIAALSPKTSRFCLDVARAAKAK